MPIERFSANKIARLLPIAVIGVFCSSSIMAATPKSELQMMNPIVFQSDVSNVDSTKQLVEQLRYAQLLHRPDITETTLKRLFAVDPNNAEGLSFQAQHLAKLGQVDQAMGILKKLEATQPNSVTTKQLRDALSIYGDNKAAYQKIILLSRSGRNKEALQALNALFPNGMPTPELQLTYLDIESGVKGHERKVLIGLKKLNADYPGVPDFQLAYAEHISKGDPSNPIAMRLLQRLSLESSVSGSAASLWISRLNDSYITKEVVQQYAILSSYYPSNATYRKALLDANKRFEKETELRKDPKYLAKLTGLKELESGHILNARQQLLTALEVRPNDPEILGGLGMVYLRLGQQEVALSYFKKAKKYDKDLRNVDRWNGYINSSSYWAYLERGEKMMQRGNFDGANRKYHQAIKYEPDDPYAYNYLAELALAQKDEEQALDYYTTALSKNRLDETALRGWFNLQISFYGGEKALEKGRKLSSRQQRILAERFHEVEISLLMTELTVAINKGDIEHAKAILDKLVIDPPVSPWQRSEVADSLRLTGQTQRADKLMSAWSKNGTPEMSFAYALYLARYGQTVEAIAQLTAVAESDRSEAMNSSLNRLEQNQMFSALFILAKNDPEAAKKEIKRLEIEYNSDPDAMLSLIDVQFQLGFTKQAIIKLQSIKPTDKWNMETELRYGGLLYTFEENEKFKEWKNHLESNSEYTVISFDQKIRRDLLFAEYAFRNEEYADAKIYYSSASQLNTEYQYGALLGQLKAQQALGEDDDAQKLALYLYSEKQALSSRQSMELTLILMAYGYQSEAIALVEMLKQKQDSDAIDYRDGMAVAMEGKEWSLATSMAHYALIEDAINPKNDATIAEFTDDDALDLELKPSEDPKEENLRELYNNADDNWLTRNVKSDLDRIQARDQGYVSFGIDYSARDGANKSAQVPIEAIIPMPEYDGHLQLRADIVHLNSGDIDYYDSSEIMNEQHTGSAFGIGWLADSWSADIGTTPLGFDQQNIVGGLNLSGDLGDVGWKATLSRRAETSSTLSYAGMTVPNGVKEHQGDEWGGVMKTGVNLGGSYDLGGSVGYWASAQFHTMTGTGVVDNTRLGLLGGTYWKIINEENRRLSLGLNLMYLNYDKNLSEYAYGNGGYYSPQQYFSVSIPVNYYERLNDGFSYLVSGSVSNSWTKEDGPYIDGSPNGSSSKGGGFGFSLEVAAEQRISKRWYLGAAVDIQRSDFYEPNHLLFYAKYTFTEHWQPIAMPVDPLTLYGDFD
ncbi:tetratricopeptide repeat protein [Aliivibrio finisterrensis]|uniref:cellulose synthase subunit BcsC-related outer membrane protein n=1 Tax=Aliivibrio finisterrensis TaxID=511998 RepID=UPI001021F2FD|nr:cellulose synthase subunit BcsC-related outer membrane protein [Aliivibrio finisterrensis]RYU70462.1 tetratricopeptide repeat protein [Aliivibrio finisterrensis]RYU74324.1 tetratricopeptide repeat protein [Aliivibrio finisterrensis]RYU76929.1 tetratricopeptide repeat protein [Aliivibrio finisterrensis]